MYELSRIYFRLWKIQIIENKKLYILQKNIWNDATTPVSWLLWFQHKIVLRNKRIIVPWWQFLKKLTTTQSGSWVKRLATVGTRELGLMFRNLPKVTWDSVCYCLKWQQWVTENSLKVSIFMDLSIFYFLNH